MVLPLVFTLALAAPAQEPTALCRWLGDVALLGDTDKYKTAALYVKKNAHHCILYHAAMAKLRLYDKTPRRPLLLEAVGLLEKIDATADPALYDWARVRRLELALRLRAPRLAPPLAELPSHLPSPEKRFLLETALLAIDSPEQALAKHVEHPLPPGRFRLQQIWDMWSLYPRHAPERHALEREIAAEHPDSALASRAEPEQSEEALLKRMAQWHARHANNSLIAAAHKSLKSGTVSAGGRCVMLFFLGAAERKLRRYAQAERVLWEAMTECQPLATETQSASKVTPIALIASASNTPPPTPTEAHKRAWFLLAQVQSISRSFETVQATVTSFVDRFKADPLTDDALLIGAASAKKHARHDEARAFMERLVKEQKNGDVCAEASFRLAWQTYREEGPAAAVPAFAALPQNGCAQDDSQRARAHYWHARMLHYTDAPKADIDAALTAAYRVAPLHYYGVIARQRLNVTPLPPPLEPAAPTETETEVGPPLSARGPSIAALEARIAALAESGLYAEAQQELAPKKPGEAPAEELAAYARLLASAHDYYRAHRPFRAPLAPLLGRAPTAQNRQSWDVAYPRPFEAHIGKAEREEKLPRDLLLSLVREESAFQLDAGSWANAYGMTQLLVETAQRTAASMPGFSKTITADLLRHEALCALQIGAHLLAKLQQRYKHPALMLAAYNAGEGAVDHWLQTRGGLPFDEFIEEIPLDETRGYVKRILGTWHIYHVLADREPPILGLGRMHKPTQIAGLARSSDDVP